MEGRAVSSIFTAPGGSGSELHCKNHHLDKWVNEVVVKNVSVRDNFLNCHKALLFFLFLQRIILEITLFWCGKMTQRLAVLLTFQDAGLTQYQHGGLQLSATPGLGLMPSSGLRGHCTHVV